MPDFAINFMMKLETLDFTKGLAVIEKRFDKALEGMEKKIDLAGGVIGKKLSQSLGAAIGGEAAGLPMQIGKALQSKEVKTAATTAGETVAKKFAVSFGKSLRSALKAGGFAAKFEKAITASLTKMSVDFSGVFSAANLQVGEAVAESITASASKIRDALLVPLRSAIQEAFKSVSTLAGGGQKTRGPPRNLDKWLGKSGFRMKKGVTHERVAGDLKGMLGSGKYSSEIDLLKKVFARQVKGKGSFADLAGRVRGAGFPLRKGGRASKLLSDKANVPEFFRNFITMLADSQSFVGRFKQGGAIGPGARKVGQTMFAQVHAGEVISPVTVLAAAIGTAVASALNPIAGAAVTAMLAIAATERARAKREALATAGGGGSAMRAALVAGATSGTVMSQFMGSPGAARALMAGPPSSILMGGVSLENMGLRRPEAAGMSFNERVVLHQGRVREAAAAAAPMATAQVKGAGGRFETVQRDLASLKYAELESPGSVAGISHGIGLPPGMAATPLGLFTGGISGGKGPKRENREVNLEIIQTLHAAMPFAAGMPAANVADLMRSTKAAGIGPEQIGALQAFGSPREDILDRIGARVLLEAKAQGYDNTGQGSLTAETLGRDVLGEGRSRAIKALSKRKGAISPAKASSLIDQIVTEETAAEFSQGIEQMTQGAQTYMNIMQSANIATDEGKTAFGQAAGALEELHKQTSKNITLFDELYNADFPAASLAMEDLGSSIEDMLSGVGESANFMEQLGAAPGGGGMPPDFHQQLIGAGGPEERQALVIGELDRRMRGLKDSLKKTGAALLGLVGAFSAMAQASIRAETATLGIQQRAVTLSGSWERYRDIVLKVSAQTGAAMEDVAKAAELAIRRGFRTPAEVQRFTESVAKVGVAAKMMGADINLAMQTAGFTFQRIGINAGDMGKAFSVLIEGSIQGSLLLDDMNTLLQQNVMWLQKSGASSLQQTERMAGFVASVQAVSLAFGETVNAQEGIGSFVSTMTSMMDPEQIGKAAAAFGRLGSQGLLNSHEMMNAVNERDFPKLAGTMLDVIGKITESELGMVGTAIERTTGMSLDMVRSVQQQLKKMTPGRLKEVERILKSAARHGGALDEAFDKSSETFERLWEQIKATFKLFLTDFGEPFNDVAKGVLKAVLHIGKVLNKMPGWLKTSLGMMTAFSIAASAAAYAFKGMAFAVNVTMLSGLKKAIGLTTSLGIAQGVTAGATVGSTAAMSVGTAALLTPAVVGGGAVAAKASQGFGASFMAAGLTPLWKSIKSLPGQIWGLFKATYQSIIKLLTGMWAIMTLNKGVKAGAGAAGALGWLGKALGKVVYVLGSFIALPALLAVGVVSLFVAFGNLVGIVGSVGGVFSTVGAILGSVIGAIPKALGWLVDLVGFDFGQDMMDFGDSIAKDIAGLFGAEFGKAAEVDPTMAPLVSIARYTQDTAAATEAALDDLENISDDDITANLDRLISQFESAAGGIGIPVTGGDRFTWHGEREGTSFAFGGLADELEAAMTVGPGNLDPRVERYIASYFETARYDVIAGEIARLTRLRNLGTLTEDDFDTAALNIVNMMRELRAGLEVGGQLLPLARQRWQGEGTTVEGFSTPGTVTAVVADVERQLLANYINDATYRAIQQSGIIPDMRSVFEVRNSELADEFAAELARSQGDSLADVVRGLRAIRTTRTALGLQLADLRTNPPDDVLTPELEIQWERQVAQLQEQFDMADQRFTIAEAVFREQFGRSPAWGERSLGDTSEGGRKGLPASDLYASEKEQAMRFIESLQDIREDALASGVGMPSSEREGKVVVKVERDPETLAVLKQMLEVLKKQTTIALSGGKGRMGNAMLGAMVRGGNG